MTDTDPATPAPTSRTSTTELGKDTPRRAFVLGGGGAWGAVELGMLRALLDAGIRPDLVVGTSIGAFNGAVFAGDPTHEGIARLEGLWRDVAAQDLLGVRLFDRVRQLVKQRVAIVDPGPLRKLLEDALSVRAIEDLQIPFQCVAAAVERAAEHWFDRGSLLDALMASAAVPALFPPVEIDGEHYYDGGLVNSVPVDRAIALGAADIYVLQVGRLEQPLRAPTRLYETALIAFELARRHRFNSMRDQTLHSAQVHVLPSANELRFDDRRQIKWGNMAETSTLIDGAYEASSGYLQRLEQGR